MRISYHLGVHGTDDERLVRGLMKDRGVLEAAGLAVPAPRLYRQILPRLARSLRGAPAGPDAQQILLDSVLEGDLPHHLIFSHENLLCFPAQAISQQGLYTNLHHRVVAYSNIFPQEDSVFFLALRNPASLIPALVTKINDGGYDALMGDVDPLSLRWAPAIRQVFETVPSAALTVWCDEDTPLLWPEVLRAVAGLGPEDELSADFDVLAQVMTEDGLTRLKAFFESHPPQSIAQRRRATSAFLDKYSRPDELEMSVELPGWTDDLVEQLTAIYDADCAEVAAIEGVNFLSPAPAPAPAPSPRS